MNLGRIHPSPHAQNQPPLLSPIGSKKVKANETLEFPVSAADPEGDPLIFVCAQLPQGANLEQRIFSWTPSAIQAGTYKAYFIAADRHGWVWEEVEIEVVKAKGTPGRR